MHYNDEINLIQSFKRPREIPMRPSAKQAVKVPLQPLQGSGDSAKRDDNSFSSIFPVSHNFHYILPDFLYLESALAPRMTEGSAMRFCSLMYRDYSKIRKF
jgi:hypothetical protein